MRMGTGAPSVLACLLMAIIARGASTEEPRDDYSWIRGANYVPSYARNDVQIWMDYDAGVIDRELGLAARLKLNSVRVFLQYAVYRHDRERFLKRYESFLSLCEKHRIRAMIVVFDSCFGDYPDIENYRDRKWMANPGQNMIGPEHWPELERYVRDVVGGYRNDRRIVMWDVMNEPMCTRHAKTKEGREKIWRFLGHFLDVVRKEDPTHPRTVGYMDSKYLPRLIDKIDVLGWHNYTGNMDQLRADIRRVKELGARYSKPVHINEIARRNTQQHFWRFMPVLKAEGMGWYFWELMLGKTQFSSGGNPIQGVVTTDGKCHDPREIAAILEVPQEEAKRLFPPRPLVRPGRSPTYRPRISFQGIRFSDGWTTWQGRGPRGGLLRYANRAGFTASWTVRGKEAVYLVHKVGPDCGIAEALIDGKVVKEIDTYSPGVDWNTITLLAKDLPKGDKASEVQVRVTGRRNRDSSNSYVQIVGYDAK